MDGAHTHGNGDGGRLVLAGVGVGAGLGAVAYLAAYIFWALAVLAACVVLAVAAALWLAPRLLRQQEAAGGAQLHAEVVTEVPRTERPAIEQHVHYHYHEAQPGRVRTVIPGKAGDVITEGK